MLAGHCPWNDNIFVPAECLLTPENKERTIAIVANQPEEVRYIGARAREELTPFLRCPPLQNSPTVACYTSPLSGSCLLSRPADF